MCIYYKYFHEKLPNRGEAGKAEKSSNDANASERLWMNDFFSITRQKIFVIAAWGFAFLIESEGTFQGDFLPFSVTRRRHAAIRHAAGLAKLFRRNLIVGT